MNFEPFEKKAEEYFAGAEVNKIELPGSAIMLERTLEAVDKRYGASDRAGLWLVAVMFAVVFLGISIFYVGGNYFRSIPVMTITSPIELYGGSMQVLSADWHEVLNNPAGKITPAENFVVPPILISLSGLCLLISLASTFIVYLLNLFIETVLSGLGRKSFVI